MFDTVVDALDDAALVSNKGLTFLNSRLEREDMSWTEVVRESKRRGSWYLSEGLEKGETLGLIIPDEKEFVLSFLGAISVGIVPVPVYGPLATGRLDLYLERTSHIFNSCRARAVLFTDALMPIISPLVSMTPCLKQCLRLEKVTQNPFQEYDDKGSQVSEIRPTDICFLQFTSGSTSEPKGVFVTHQSLIANITGIVEVVGMDPENERSVCWLPLYHDMGLVAYVLLPTLLHSEVIFMSPFTFVTRPQVWLETISKYRATTSASPNFGLALAVKYAHRLNNINLSCLEAIVCGAEPVNPATIRSFNKVFRPMGLRSTVVRPAYGMAEATLCISISEKKRAFRTIAIDREECKNNHRVKIREDNDPHRTIEVVSLGRPIPEHDIGIIDEECRQLDEGYVGEIVFRGKSVTKGYYGSQRSSNELFYGEWMRTGDLGFIINGELYICGRMKDLIIIAGRNYHPQLIEWSVEKVDGIRAGNVVAFSLSGKDTERLVIVAECEDNFVLDDLRQEVQTAIQKDFNIRPFDIVFVSPRTLPKTSSGKSMRQKTKELYEAERLVVRGISH